MSQQLKNLTVSAVEAVPEGTMLSVATINQHVILVYKVFFASLEAVQTLNLNSVAESLICMRPELSLANDMQLHVETGNMDAFIRSGMNGWLILAYAHTF